MTLSILSCKQKYHVVIAKQDPDTGLLKEDVIEIKEKSDSAAFTTGAAEYWKKKCAIQRVKHDLGYSGDELKMFYVTRANGTHLSFSEEDKERLATPVIQQYFNLMLRYDTSKLRNKRLNNSANIY